MNDYRNFQRRQGQRRLGKGKHGYRCGKGKYLLQQKNKYPKFLSTKYLQHQQQAKIENEPWTSIYDDVQGWKRYVDIINKYGIYKSKFVQLHQYSRVYELTVNFLPDSDY